MFLTILLLGCTQLTAKQIAEKMREKYDTVKDMKGTMVVTTNFGKKQTQNDKL